MNHSLFWIIAILFFLSNANLYAQGCAPATAQFDLNTNNVRARILNGGDLWWNPVQGVPLYEAPAGSGKMALYAGALWMGGIDTFGQLRIAAQTYRQTGNDFFPGILNDDGETDAATCNMFDFIRTVNAIDINNFIAAFIANGGLSLPISSVPTAVLQWPGRNNPHFTDFDLPLNKDLAPFYDYNNDGYYDPTTGDYPVIASGNPTYANQMTWCVFNDNGSFHSETNGMPLQVEIGLLAYAFSEPAIGIINNATFYRYTVRNYNPTRIDSFRVGIFVDPDLGDAFDDYVGCMPAQNMGYVYNCDNNDGIYGTNPPAVGVQFLDPINGNNNEDVAMASFMTYNNDFTPTGNPENAGHFYNYLHALWKNDTYITENGGSSPTPTGIQFMYPDNPNDAAGLSECALGKECGDRRFVMAMDNISLPKNGVKDFTIGVYYVPDIGGCPNTDILPLSIAATEAEAYHNNLGLLNVGIVISIPPIIDHSTPLINVYFNAPNTICYIHTAPNIEYIAVYDLSGRCIVPPTAIDQILELNTQSWQNSYYLLQAITQNGQQYSQKISNIH